MHQRASLAIRHPPIIPHTGGGPCEGRSRKTLGATERKRGRIYSGPNPLKSEAKLATAVCQYLLHVNVSNVQLPTVIRLFCNARS